MTSEFAPISELVKSSHELELNYHDQLHLATEIKRTATQLDDIPFLIPTQKNILLNKIPIKGLKGDLNRDNTLSVFLSETNEDKKAAGFKITERGQPAIKFELSPAGDMWEEWRPGETEPTHNIENSSLLSLLASRLKDDHFLSEMLDQTHIDAMAMTHLFADQLKRSARQREITTRYQPTITPTEDEPTFETLLATKETNRQTIHRFAIASIYNVGNARIEKQYSYTSTKSGSSVRGTGVVSLESRDGVPQSRLDYYTATDQEQNYPLDTLHFGLAALRRQYDLYDQRRAA